MRRMIALLGLFAALVTPGARAEPPAPGAVKGGMVESFDDPAHAGPLEGAPDRRRQTNEAGARDSGPPGSETARSGAPRSDLSDTSGQASPRPRPKMRRRPPPHKPAPAVAVAGQVPPVEPVSALTDWKDLDPDNTLVIDTSQGQVVVELHPEVAPASVARVRRLARDGVYDGLLFHRVIDGFVAQTGNPDNHDGGKSSLPNLPPEFTFRLGADVAHLVVARQGGDNSGFLGALPYESVDEGRMAASPDHRITAWGAYCAGVMGMGRDAAPNSGNSEIFFMRNPARRLERDYTAVGRIILGLDVVRRLAVGEPPAHPDRMTRVTILADLPAPQRPRLQVLNISGPEFKAIVDRARLVRGADFSVCDVDIPVRSPPPTRSADNPIR